MSDSMFLGVAIFVFAMMTIGLGLTILEFRFGQPSRDVEKKTDHGEIKPNHRHSVSEITRRAA